MTCSKCNNLNDIEDLSIPYVIRTCSECGREIKVREIDEVSLGINVEEGDKFVIPEGYLQLSANPLKGKAHFTKNGLSWFAERTFVEDIMRHKDNFNEILEKNDKYSEERLENSEIVNDLDLQNPEHVEEIFQRFEENKYTTDYWAFWFKIYNGMTQRFIKEKDSIRASWAMACAERCRSMIVFKENFEDVIWMGQSVRRIIDVIHQWDANKENGKEEFWQQLLNQHSYILSQIFSVPVMFLKDKAYVGGLNIDRHNSNFVDYLFAAGSSNDAVLIEIKTPVTRLLGGRYRGLYKPSVELSGSVVQVLDYRRELVRNLRELVNGTLHEIDVFNPKCIVIVGNYEAEITDEDKKKSFELYRTNFRDVEIITYDELFKMAERLAKLFNIVKKD